jgi:hypothetical protein
MMTKFMVLYRAPVTAREQMAASGSPEQAQAGMDAWMAWAGKAGDAIVDLGAPLADAAWVGPGSGDGLHVTGFSIMQAESADELTAILDGHPHLGFGGSVEVLEFLSIPGM